MITIYVKACETHKSTVLNLLTCLSLENIAYELQYIALVRNQVKEHSILFYEIENVSDVEEIETICNEMPTIRIIIIHKPIGIVYPSQILGYVYNEMAQDEVTQLKKIILKEAVVMNSCFHYSSSFMRFDINPQNVMYIESYHHDVYIYTRHMRLKARDSLKNYIVNNAYVKLIQTHKSFVVNLAYVEEIEKDSLRMYDKKVIPLGNKYKVDLNNDLSNFINFK